jgi:hypothetical protein
VFHPSGKHPGLEGHWKDYVPAKKESATNKDNKTQAGTGQE